MVVDPEQIRAVAVRLRADGEHARRLARRVQATGEVPWRSPAAHLFRLRVAERAHGLQRCAHDLEVAARLVEVHAEAVAVARTEAARVLALGAGLGARVAGRR